jgi:hypothetical protein
VTHQSRPRPARRLVTPEVEAAIADLLPVTTSLRSIAAKLGINYCTMRPYAGPLIALMRAAGTLPSCGCGKERFHKYPCIISRQICPERRDAIVSEITTGELYRDIGVKFGIGRLSARNYLRYLTPAQRRRRLDLQRSRRPEAAAEARPFGDNLYARIATAVPRWLTNATRDDVISEIYLAVLEGTLDAAAIEANVARFARAGAAAYESKFGPRSLDERRFDDSERTLAETIPDPYALAAFDYIFEGTTA